VPLCRNDHRQLHQHGNEVAWWANLQIAPLQVANDLWLQTLLGEDPRPPKREPLAVFLILEAFLNEVFYLLARSGNTNAQTTFSPNAITAFEKSHIRATAPGLRAGITTVSPRVHFRISSEAFVSLSRKPADTGRQ
jgi:hypothetical protein